MRWAAIITFDWSVDVAGERTMKFLLSISTNFALASIQKFVEADAKTNGQDPSGIMLM
jgi:hypothetical protein